jgi:hypothetical protein
MIVMMEFCSGGADSPAVVPEKSPGRFLLRFALTIQPVLVLCAARIAIAITEAVQLNGSVGLSRYTLAAKTNEEESCRLGDVILLFRIRCGIIATEEVQ